jgi:multiple sugar transport system substrate-binding protein
VSYLSRTSLRTRKRRALAGAALATIAVACLGAGCTGPRTATAGTSPWATPTGNAVTTVTILSGTDTSVSAGTRPVQPGEPGMYSELVNWWNQHEEPVTRIHVVLDTVPGGATAEHSEMLADAETGDAAYDIYNLDNEWVPEFAAGNYISALPGKLRNGFLAQPLASGTYDGQLYAAPFTTDVGLLYYRTDLVSKEKVTGLTSFKGLVDLAAHVMTTHHDLRIGYAGQFASYEGLTVNLLEIIHSLDPNAFAASGAIRDSNAVTQGLTELSTVAMTSEPTGVIPSYELGYTESQAVAAFTAGQALFMRNWPIYYEQLVTAKGAGSSQVASHVGVAPLPFPSVLGGQDLAIAQASSHPADALKVIEYLTSKEAERCLFAVAGFPATRSSAYAPGKALPPGYEGINGYPLCGTQVGPSLLIGQTILDSIDGLHGTDKAFLRPRTRYYTEFSSIIQKQVPKLLLKALGGASMTGPVAALVAALNSAAAGRAPPS